MYHPTTRVLTVLELLQSHHRITGAQLAARLEVDTRTVRRYITMLQDLGIPVEAERGRYGAYRLRPGYKLPPLMFNEDEALALTLGLLAAQRLGLAAAGAAVEGALAKVERVLPALLRSRIQAVQAALRLDMVAPESRPDSEIIVTLSTAAQQSRRVWLRYRAGNNAETERAIDPYGLVYRAGRWYAAAYCHLRDDLRMFRLDRMASAELRDETFVRPAGFDSREFVVRTLAAMPGAWSVRVLLETTLERAQRNVPADMATLEERPGGIEMRCDVEDLPYIARFLMGLSHPFVVLQPPELRETLRQLAAQVTRQAARVVEADGERVAAMRMRDER